MKLRHVIAFLLLTLAACSLAGKHPANIPSARAKIQPNGAIDLRVRFDILAFLVDQSPNEVADGPMNALLDGPADELQSRLSEAQARFRRNLKLIGDNGPGVIASVVFPTASEIHALVDQGEGPRLPVMMSINIGGHFRDGVKTAALQFPSVLGSVVLTTELPYTEPISEPVEPGSASTPVTVPTPAQVKAIADAMLAPRQSNVVPREKPAPAKAPAPSPSPAKAVVAPEPPKKSRAAETPNKPVPLASPAKPEAREKSEPPAKKAAPSTESGPPEPAPLTHLKSQQVSLLASLPRYVKMGYTHILPEGLDHILFVLGLFLLSRRPKDLIKQITAFTVAHSLTLALSLYGVVRLPSTIVEPIIALSIAFVAIENLVTAEVKAWRLYVVFLFGLVHGLGFATALTEAGLSRSDMLPALVGFNVGVELGQLSVVALAWLLVARFQQSPKYRPVFAIPASIAIAVIAVVWTVQRVF